MSKITWGIILLLVIGLGVYFYMNKEAAPDATGGESAQAPTASWAFTPAGEDPESAAPLTTVSAVINGKTHALGTYMGSCAEIAGSSWQLLENEVSGVICWWAGGGTEIGVFAENGAYVVKKGQLDEGNAEIPGFRGNFETVVSLL